MLKYSDDTLSHRYHYYRKFLQNFIFNILTCTSCISYIYDSKLLLKLWLFQNLFIFSSLFNLSSRLQNKGRGNLHDLHLPNTYISCITFNSTENPFIIAQLIPYHPRKGALVKGLHVIFLISCFLLHKHSLFVPRLLEVLFLQSPGEITIEIPSSHTLVYVLFWYLFVIHQKKIF